MKKLLVKNADWILTMDSAKRRFRHGDILVEGNRIAAVGERLGVQADEVLDASGMVIIPGMVNTHHHCFQSLVRNIHVANGLRLEPWLAAVYDIFRELDEEAVYHSAVCGLGDLLKTGCTTSNDHHYAHPRGQKALIDVTIRAASALGIRFQPTRGSLTVGKSQGSPHVPDDMVETTDAIMEDCERLVRKYHDASRFSMCRVDAAPCWPEFETPEILRATADFVRKYGINCHSHLAESKGEFAYCREKFGCTPVEFADRYGWLGERFYYAHCVQLTDSDVRRLAASGTGVAHCPNSNMFLNSGVARIPELRRLGARVGIGVDGAASNNSSNMMTEIRNTYLVHQLTWGAEGLTAEEVLELATVGGARVLGRDDIGFLAPDMAADFVLMNWNQFPYAGGRNDPAASIVLSGDARMVDTVFVNGEMTVSKGKLTRIDEACENRLIHQAGKGILTRAALREERLKIDL